MGYSRQEHYYALLQGIFLTLGSNLRFLHLLSWQVGSLPPGGWVAMVNSLKGSLRLLLEMDRVGRAMWKRRKKQWDRGTGTLAGQAQWGWRAGSGRHKGEPGFGGGASNVIPKQSW